MEEKMDVATVQQPVMEMAKFKSLSKTNDVARPSDVRDAPPGASHLKVSHGVTANCPYLNDSEAYRLCVLTVLGTLAFFGSLVAILLCLLSSVFIGPAILLGLLGAYLMGYVTHGAEHLQQLA